MSNDYVPPKHNQSGFSCPNPECEAYSRQQWHMHIGGFRNPKPDPAQLMKWFSDISIAQCDKCGASSI